MNGKESERKQSWHNEGTIYHFPQGNEENYETSVRIADASGEIQT
jgi:hypothetical protein